jgi:hypothetical protein
MMTKGQGVEWDLQSTAQGRYGLGNGDEHELEHEREHEAGSDGDGHCGERGTLRVEQQEVSNVTIRSAES